MINFQFSCLPDRQAIFNFQLFFDAIMDLAKKEGVVFLRFEPTFQIPNSKFQIPKTLDVQPSKTIILDLVKSEEELLKAMHPKTRYNIRLAEKKGVIIREAEAGEFDSFWRLLDDTCKRDGFRSHEGKYYDKMLKIGNNVNGKNSKFQIPNSKQNPKLKFQNLEIYNELKIKLFFAVYNSRVIAANIIGFFGDTATYIHGASGNESRNVMAPYLLQWETIKLAKRLGYRYYDFYGIDEKKWPVGTRFKRGFGGSEIDYPGTFDMVFGGMWYHAYRMMRKIRRYIK